MSVHHSIVPGTGRLALMVMSMLALTVVASCDSETVVYTAQTSTKDGRWGVEKTFEFDALLNDTSTYYDIQLLVDNREDYPYRNMYVFFDIQFPNERWSRDTVEFYLTDPTGRWVGEKSADLYHNQVLYRYKRKLPLSGDYHIEISHGMRDEQLEGVEAVGVRIIETP